MTKQRKTFTRSYTEVNPPAEVKDGDLSNLPHKIEALVSYRRAKITLKYTVFTFWRRYNIHTVGLWILSTDRFQSVHISLIDILVPNSVPYSKYRYLCTAAANPNGNGSSDRLRRILQTRQL